MNNEANHVPDCSAIPPEARVERIRRALPAEGLFAGKEWLVSPDPFPLSPERFRFLEDFGRLLDKFTRACNELYRLSVRGKAPAWIHEYLDRGKPRELVESSRSKSLASQVARVIRPDLLLTETGFAVSELDNLPGGIGLTAWMNQAYSGLGDDVIGGGEGMLDGFEGIHPNGADIIVSRECSDYRPEMDWLAAQLNRRAAGGEGKLWKVLDAESYAPGGDERGIYRFLELFDLGNIPSADAVRRVAEDGTRDVSPPFKPFLEEKLWSALFWMRPLRPLWSRLLRESNRRRLEEVIPYSWIVDPSPLPQHAVIPRLDINRWEEMGEFSQAERQLVLKISGFSELAWGGRSVRIGHDLSQDEWRAAIREALERFETNPYVLQEFQKSRIVEHSFWNAEARRVETMKGRVRLCPYYFIGGDGSVGLKGVLATVCPADKKILHGMRDAIMAPCRVSESGY